MMLPCMVNHWLYVLSDVNTLLGTASWVRMASASKPPHQEEGEGGDHVEDADLLVIGGGQPAEHAGGAGTGDDLGQRALVRRLGPGLRHQGHVAAPGRVKLSFGTAWTTKPMSA